MKKTRMLAMLLALVMMLCVFAGCGNNEGSNSGEKINFTIIQVLQDKTELELKLNVASGSTLREALYEAGYIAEEELAAMFITTINGHSADAINDGVTWMVTDDKDEQIMGTFDEIFPEDGQTIKLVWYVVPNFD